MVKYKIKINSEEELHKAIKWFEDKREIVSYTLKGIYDADAVYAIGHSYYDTTISFTGSSAEGISWYKEQWSEHKELVFVNGEVCEVFEIVKVTELCEGLRPKYVAWNAFYADRTKEIINAVVRYNNEDKKIPIEWLEELCDLNMEHPEDTL